MKTFIIITLFWYLICEIAECITMIRTGESLFDYSGWIIRSICAAISIYFMIQ